MRGIETVCLKSVGLLMLGMQGSGKAQLVMKGIGLFYVHTRGGCCPGIIAIQKGSRWECST